MPHSAPDFCHRAQLVERMDEPCTRDQLRACLRDIALSNRWTLGYRPTLHWLNTIASTLLPRTDPLRILDVGSGYGDALRRIEHWAAARDLSVELTGLDLNPDAAIIAAEATPVSSNIRWVTTDVFAYTPSQPPHLILSSLFAHHLSNANIVRFLRWMEHHAQLSWFINDLSRAPIPYHAFRIFATLARLHPFVQYDGPVSVARSFIPDEWRALCAEAGLAPNDFQIQPFKPARLCIARRLPR
jgi:SAM-dependent methyltransferase